MEVLVGWIGKTLTKRQLIKFHRMRRALDFWFLSLLLVLLLLLLLLLSLLSLPMTTMDFGRKKASRGCLASWLLNTTCSTCSKLTPPLVVVVCWFSCSCCCDTVVVVDDENFCWWFCWVCWVCCCCCLSKGRVGWNLLLLERLWWFVVWYRW